ncbi:hypothetical protein BGZ76_004210 [Entomortierella beljakovae]|nr:hypothetical protein BGZ76_004210 [Entomortierella beljakovae]
MLTVISPFGSTALHTQAVPAKHRPSSKNVLNDMSISYSDNSPMPLQLQIESQTMGKQTLEYLPTTGQSIDFHYINYRPLHQAGESQMDFWMLTPKGTPAPKTGSLELYDEFGKVRLAVLVPEGTEIPQDIANKNVPFFWKSWVIPKTLDADFNFSERFRVVLKTSDSKHLVEADIKYNKREDLGFELKVKGKNKHINDADNADTIVSPSRSGIAIVQDHQFRIEELEAMPGE